MNSLGTELRPSLVLCCVRAEAFVFSRVCIMPSSDPLLHRHKGVVQGDCDCAIAIDQRRTEVNNLKIQVLDIQRRIQGVCLEGFRLVAVLVSETARQNAVEHTDGVKTVVRAQRNFKTAMPPRITLGTSVVLKRGTGDFDSLS